MQNSESFKFLENQGCCRPCVYLFHGNKKEIEGTLADCRDEKLPNKHEEFSDTSSAETMETVDGVNGISESECKKNRWSTCPTCLGILQYSTSAETLNELSEKIIEEKSDSPSFSLTITLPICLSIRIHCMWTHLLRKFPLVDQSTAREYHYGSFKDIWRQITGNKLAKIVGKEFKPPENSPFTLSAVADYKNEMEECLAFEKIDQKIFDKRREQKNKFHEGLYSRIVVTNLLRHCDDEEFAAIFSQLPVEPVSRVSFGNSKCSHTSIYIAGRYNKFSRELPQTPWFVEGKRKLESSVEELMSTKIQEALRCRCVFSSSGREDVDVRCLGTGRPFVLECLNPRKTRLSPEDTGSLQKEINEATSLIRIKDLQLVSKESRLKMKEGEEEKTKTYVALCLCRKGLAGLDLEILNRTEELVIGQLTPLRVLHRRSLATRERTVHSMEATKVDDHFFKLTLVADAGTYIKEFVHGDFGRTTPNLGTILSTRMDIVALDVIDVKLDWPPRLSAE